jgi:hypothetical protein
MDKNPYTPPTAVVADIAASDTPRRPATVAYAIGLIWLSFGSGLPGAIQRALASPVPAGMSHTLLIVLYLVLYAAFFGLVFWLTSAIGKGKGWSRVVITVLVAINLLLIIWMLAEYPFAALQANLQARGTSVTLYLLKTGADFAAVVLLFTTAADAWFAKWRATRRADSGG